MERSEMALTSAECWELLAGASVGRVALSVRALPVILPVRFSIAAGSVDIGLDRLGPSPVSMHDAVVAFVVDDIDEWTGAGWKVQVQGRVRLVPGCSASGSGAGGQVARLTPGMVTGNRFTLHPTILVG